MGNLSLWPQGDSDSEPEEPEPKGARGGSSEAHLERGCSDLYEDDEDSEAAPTYVFVHHILYIAIYKNLIRIVQIN